MKIHLYLAEDQNLKKMSIKNNPIAIIDIGSSSVRLVIFDEQKFSASVIFNEKVTLNLGKGIFMKRIDESELQNLIKVLKCLFFLGRFLNDSFFI